MANHNNRNLYYNIIAFWEKTCGFHGEWRLERRCGKNALALIKNEQHYVFRIHDDGGIVGNDSYNDDYLSEEEISSYIDYQKTEPSQFIKELVDFFFDNYHRHLEYAFVGCSKDTAKINFMGVNGDELFAEFLCEATTISGANIDKFFKKLDLSHPLLAYPLCRNDVLNKALLIFKNNIVIRQEWNGWSIKFDTNDNNRNYTLENGYVDEFSDHSSDVMLNGNNMSKETFVAYFSQPRSAKSAEWLIYQVNCILHAAMTYRPSALEIHIENERIEKVVISHDATISGDGKWEVEVTDGGRNYINAVNDALTEKFISEPSS